MTNATATIRAARLDDAAAIAAICNEGIEERESTFETRSRSGADFASRLANPSAPPFLVADLEDSVLGWARIGPYSSRDCYSGVSEASVYVTRGARGQGLGRALFEALAAEAASRGYWKIVGLLFPTNLASVALCRATGCREVGIHRRHGQLEGRWRDVLLVEKLLD